MTKPFKEFRPSLSQPIEWNGTRNSLDGSSVKEILNAEYDEEFKMSAVM